MIGVGCLRCYRYDTNLGGTLMVAKSRGGQNRRMKNEAPAEPTKIRTPRPRIADLVREIDERDETIRLLNEALSKALDELRLSEAA